MELGRTIDHHHAGAAAPGERSELRDHRQQIDKSAALTAFVAGLIHLELLRLLQQNRSEAEIQLLNLDVCVAPECVAKLF